MNKNTEIKKMQDLLVERGYELTQTKVIKNGIKFEGFEIVRKGEPKNNIRPVIYFEEIYKNMKNRGLTLEEAVDDIIVAISRQFSGVNIQTLFTREEIVKKVYVGIQKTSSENLLKRDSFLDGIEEYLYIADSAGEDNFSIKLTASNIVNINVTENVLWEAAIVNTCKETTIDSLNKIICQIKNMKYDEEMDEAMPLFVISNKRKFRGAAGILNRNILIEFAKRYNVDQLIILPSSIHECIIIPDLKEKPISEWSDMVNEINEAEVDAIDRLVDKAYIYKVA